MQIDKISWIKSIVEQEDCYLINNKTTVPKNSENRKCKDVLTVINNIDNYSEVVYTTLLIKTPKELQEELQEKLAITKAYKTAELRDWYDKEKYKLTFLIKKGAVVNTYITDLSAFEVYGYIGEYIVSDNFPVRVDLYNIPKGLTIDNIRTAQHIKNTLEPFITNVYKQQYYDKAMKGLLYFLENCKTQEDLVNMPMLEVPRIIIDLTAF
tara:strand:+ start:68 stop:697 length:630 start_codon:yes stop_codon:yes gene_type:complete